MSEHEHKHEVRIHIDEHKYESPSPTTGAALYELGNVAAGLELYREVTGDREDREIENGPEPVHLKEDEHLHSGPPKVFTIIVNGRRKEVSTKTLSFDQVGVVPRDRTVISEVLKSGPLVEIRQTKSIREIFLIGGD